MGVVDNHVLSYQQHSGFRLKSVCDFGIEKLKDIKSKFREASNYNNDQSILEDVNIDIISIDSYDNYHLKPIVKAFENGKHVMGEKQLCLRLDELIELYSLHEKMPC